MNATSSLATIFSLTLNHDWSLSLTVNLLIGAALIFAIVFVVFARWYFWGRSPNFEIDGADVGIGPHSISFKPNLRDQEVAYKIWVELSTRKIGLPIDLEHDVISEIYDSWHNFFSITRELIKDIPVNKVKRSSTREIITLSISVLNEGLRPHLTLWQARFRRWYDKTLEGSTTDADPQSIQAEYPKYKELTKDLLEVNDKLIWYREKMRELVLGLPSNKDTPDKNKLPKKPSL